MERTLVIAKPDAVQRGLIGEIITRLEKKGLKLIGLKMIQLEDALLREHYAEHIEKSFYKGLEEFMKSSPVVVMAWEGFECTASVRLIVGSTNPREAQAGTLRGDFSIGVGRNIVHASDGPQAGQDEVNRFFNDNELLSYDKSEYLHIYEPFERG
jgi:nucleoside-diphosphate kinase